MINDEKNCVKLKIVLNWTDWCYYKIQNKQKIVQTLSENFPISYSTHFIDLDENLQIIYLEK